MTADEFYSVHEGDTVVLNTELWIGQGPGKEPEILKEGTSGTVVSILVGFFNYFLFVDMQGKTRKFKIMSLEKA